MNLVAGTVRSHTRPNRLIGTLAGHKDRGGWRIGADEAAAGQLVAIQDGRAMDKAQNGLGVSDEGVCYTLDGTGAQAVALDTYNQSISADSPTLRDPNGTFGDALPAASIGSVVRRLTPTECERLQGFPDGWTIPDGESLRETQTPRSAAPFDPQPDGPRYAAMGDAVTVPVIEWIGRRLVAHEASR